MPVNTRLRIYRGPEEATPATHEPRTVSVPLEEVLPMLVEAFQSRRTWLEDFAQDEVQMSADLYEVLLAYRFFRRPSA